MVGDYLDSMGYPMELREDKVRSELHCLLNDALQREGIGLRGNKRRDTISEAIKIALCESGYQYSDLGRVYIRSQV